jgi:crotonobetainyl-CoA:carnitine CoA-transferase CaiB-like acyl-CoA transferase
MIACPIRVPGAAAPTRAAPAMGADTEAELRAAGYPAERIAALRAAGVIA